MKLLVTGAWNGATSELNKLLELGHSVTFMQNEVDALPCKYEEVEGVICNGLFLSHDIKKFTSLKYIQLTSAGFDRVDMNYVLDNGIKIFNARGVYSIPMAEFSISGVLSLYKGMKFFTFNQQKRAWVKNRGALELYGKTVCIVGAGNVGTECAKRFKAFGCKVVGVDLYPRVDANYEEILPLSLLDNALKVADVVVLTLPLTDETKHMMNEERFSKMKDGSVLVNIARGAVIEENALINALDNKLLGAVLDVFEVEPLSENSPLWQKENAIITPHNSFVGDGNVERLNKVIFDNLGEVSE
ncbi:MAG: hydroxyacid dehydrogenase [Clostridia bacterium]|nr:hydroxyacid dehydrogenase [Clostridia bacterium]